MAVARAVKKQPKQKNNTKGGNGAARPGTGKKPSPAVAPLPALDRAEEKLGSSSGKANSSKESEKTGVATQYTSPQQDGGAWVLPDGAGIAERDVVAHLHLVTFNLDREEYGVAIDRVQEIIRVGQITPVPNIPEYIRGVINLRGRIIPVLDLRKKLHLPEGERTKHSRIMIVEAGLKILGMLVDAVSQVFWLPFASIEEAPWESERAKGYVKSIGKHDSRLILLIDLDRVLEKEMPQAADEC